MDNSELKNIDVKTCTCKVTGSYNVEDWRESKKSWNHLNECDFPEPAGDRYLDLLIGVDYYSCIFHVDIRGESGVPVARLGLLGWTCIGSPDRGNTSASRSHVVRTLFSRDSSSSGCCDINQSIKRFWEIETYGSQREQYSNMHRGRAVGDEKSETIRHL